MSEVPYGVLLSGGLDSSLIAAIAARETERVLIAQKRRGLEGDVDRLSHGEGAGLGADDDNAGLAAWPRLHSFSIGLPGSPDLLAAREVAKYLGTVHHEHTFTVEEGLDALQDVIYHLETFDVTTIRASTPMYLLSRKIKAQGVKMVLSGEGSDEIFAGNLTVFIAYDRLPLLPRRSVSRSTSRRMRSTSQELERRRLSPSKQVNNGMGSRSTCSVLG